MEPRLVDKQFTAFVEECMTQYQDTHGVSHRRIVWTDKDEIIKILNLLCQKAPLFNMFLPKRNLLRFQKVGKATEKGFIECSGGTTNRYIKPKQLVLNYMPDFTMWSYFRLESEPVQPLEKFYCNAGFNEAIELKSGEYVDRSFNDVPEFREENYGYKVLMRYYKGDFVICPVQSPYNRISQSTDDGRHNDLTMDEFDFYITRCIANWNLLDWNRNDYDRNIADIKRVYANNVLAKGK